MNATVYRRSRRQWLVVALLGSLVPLLGGTAAWPQGEAMPAAPSPAAKRSMAHVAVQQGRLSVHLQDAEVRHVLARIARQADIVVHYHARSDRRVSMQLTDVELEKGLQRLLRQAALSYTILYIQRPGGEVAIREVQVFDAGQGERPQPAPSPAVVDSHPTAQTAGGDPPSESDGENVVEQLARHLAVPPQMTGAEQQELVHRFLEVLRLHDQEAELTSPPPAPSLAVPQGEGLEGAADTRR
jgi:hypothetical protein